MWLVVPTGFMLFAAAFGLNGRPFLGGVSVVLALLAAIAGVLVTRPATRWLTPMVVPLALSSLLGTYGATDRGALRGRSMGDYGFTDRASGLALVGLVFGLLLALRVDVGRHLARVIGIVSRAITLGAGATVFVLVILPGWVWSRLRRHDVLRPGDPSGTTWVKRPATGGRPTSLGAETPGHPGGRTLVGRVVWAVGCVVLLAGANYGLGWAWDRATGEQGPNSVSQTLSRGSTSDVARDPRIDEPAMAAYRWRERYFADIQRTSGGYWPFTESRPRDFTSPYVNLRGWERRSYESPGDDAGRPVVWMFGGSTAWGEGQRDRYTIASYVARLAEQDGTPIEMVNYGQRGWTHFQEMVLYEQRLAEGPAPDLSIFYDGANELTTQSLLTEAVPSHTLAYTYAQKLAGGTIATEFVQEPAGRDIVADLWYAYSDHSAVHKVARLFRSEPAGASTAQGPATDRDPGGGFVPGQDQEEDGGVSNYDITNQDGIDAGQVYERGKQLTMALSAQYDVRSLLFWQPIRFDGEPQRLARGELTDSTIDISDALAGHDDVFIDGGHTNEEGARLVAEAIWERLGPAVRDWYDNR